MSSTPSSKGAGPPWAWLAGGLTGCGVTLIGVLRGLDPDVILVRAVLSALLLGGVAGTARYLTHRFLGPL